jgi:hypothetical protein
MPFYNIRNKPTGHEWQELCSWSELQQLLEKFPEFELLPSRPNFGDPIRMGITKPPESFRDLLRNMKKHKPRSRINTFD